MRAIQSKPYGRCHMVSETKADEIRKKNKKLIDDLKAKKRKLQIALGNHRQAKELGLTVEEYINLTGGEK